jgi:hypothetical protein
MIIIITITANLQNASLKKQNCDETWTEHLTEKRIGKHLSSSTVELDLSIGFCFLSSEAFLRRKSYCENNIASLETLNKELRVERLNSTGFIDSLIHAVNNCNNARDKLYKRFDDLVDEKEKLKRIRENLEENNKEWKSAWENQDYGFCVKSCEILKTAGCNIARNAIPHAEYFITC